MNRKTIDEDELASYPIRDLVEGWFFRITEVSMNVYRVEGIDHVGRTVSRVGNEFELNDLLQLCARDAEEIKRAVGE